MERADGWSRVEGRGSKAAALDSRLSTFDRLRQKLVDAFLHFAGGLVGEGDGEDVGRCDALGKQMGDTKRDDAGLAGAGPGKNQHRAIQRFDGLALLGIE